ncbi:MAG: hypothetical protein U0R24_02700 [Solirubrobacterales bacterium]
MAKKSKSKSKAKKLKRDDDLFAQLREQGVRKSVADQIARASAGLDSGKKKAEQGVRDAAESFRKLAADLEAKLPGDTELVPKAAPAKKPATRRTTAAKKPATRRTTAAKKPATGGTTAAKKPAARRTTKSTAASRSAAAKKAAATRKRNAAAKKAAETRAEGSS